MQERRGATRYSCQLGCVVQIGAQRHDATVFDLSSSGLAIRTQLDLAQGDEVALVIDSTVHVSAIAWRTGRTRRGFLVGLMLSAESADFDALVGRFAARHAPTSAPDATQPCAAPPAPAEHWWRLRVKDNDGNRTRVVALAAPSRDDAIARALLEIGGGWEILEAKLAPHEAKKET